MSDHDGAPVRPTPLEWSCLVVGALLMLQYAWFLDDAFIYYRYVDNWVILGRGLCFNPGEYVEGYSSPLWLLMLSALRALRLDWWLITRFVGIASFAATWWLLVVLDRRVVPRAAPRLNFVALYLCSNYAVLTYFTSGAESPLVQLAAVGFALYLVAPRNVAAQVLVGLAPMIRHELAAPLVIAVAWTWLSTKRFPWRVVGLCAATLGAWTVFRVIYYADLFPNTFHLKNEVEWTRGWTYLHDTARTYAIYVLAPMLVALALLLRRRGIAIGGRVRLVMLAAAGVVALYVARIGGDPRHYRYLAFPFCLAACASSGLVEQALSLYAPRLSRRAIAVLGVVLLVVFAWQHPRQLAGHPIDRQVEHVQIDGINDAQYHRLRADLGFSPWTLGSACERLTPHEMRWIYGWNSPLVPREPSCMRIEYARWIERGATMEDHDVATDGWCVRMYKRFAERLIHFDGLTDAVLARTLAASNRAGHKRDLHRLSDDLAVIRTRFGLVRGAFRRAVDARLAPDWIERNLDALERIERKAYNRHALLENLELAFTPVPDIDPGDDVARPPPKRR